MYWTNKFGIQCYITAVIYRLASKTMIQLGGEFCSFSHSGWYSHKKNLRDLWGHPHVIPSPSPIQSRFTSQLSFLRLHTNPHTDPDNSNLTTTT